MQQATNPPLGLSSSPFRSFEEALEYGRRYVAEKTPEQRTQERVDAFNATEGDVDGACEICRRKGLVSFVQNGGEYIRPCDCMVIVRTKRAIEQSGLSGLMDSYTFDAFAPEKPWQQAIKDAAMRYVDQCEGNWLFIGGQVGSGKTHLCTAVVGELLNRGYPARYMLWRDESVRLKAAVNDAESYDAMIRQLKTVRVLYIDDFLKTKPREEPTAGDLNLAFEILNYRYNDANLITVISSERDVNAIIDIDEAIGSRIRQRARNFTLIVGADRSKNYRVGATS